jgi:hypothetical protein
MTKKPVNLRIDEKLLKEFDELEGSRTENIEGAMRMYLQRKEGRDTNIHTNVNTDANPELISNYQKMIDALEGDKKYLQEKFDKMEIANEELRKSLAFEQQAHFEAQKQLPPMKKGKWKFWKK